MPKLLTIVLAAGMAQRLIEANEKFWLLQNPEELVYVAPADDLVRTAMRQVHHGLSGRYGWDMTRRTQLALKTFVDSPCEWLLLHEHDSVCISRSIHFTKGMVGNLVPMQVCGIDSYQAGDPFAYLNAPYLMDRNTVELMYDKAMAYPTYHEQGVIDRYLSALARLCGIPLMNHTPLGYGDHTNKFTHIGHDKRSFDMAMRAVMRGATMFHGVKSSDIGQRLADARKKAGFLE